ncbi:MAG TPA: rhomboid family intramembrane serine protease [Gemmatimonadales bacterium]
MIPYRDENPTTLKPIVTVGIIILNVAAWLFLEGAGTRNAVTAAVCNYGLIPGEVLQRLPPGTGIEMAPGLFCAVDPGPQYWTVFTSMFMHGGWMHLIGNMVFFWVFGNNIEDAMGHVRFLIFYLVCGVAAAAAQTFANQASAVPMVGASGAISGVLGAYLLLYPRVRVHALLPLGFYITTITMPAYVMLGYWILLQVLGSLPALGSHQAGGTAFLAHIGGFVAGLVLIRLFARREYLERRVVLPGGYGWGGQGGR